LASFSCAKLQSGLVVMQSHHHQTAGGRSAAHGAVLTVVVGDDPPDLGLAVVNGGLGGVVLVALVAREDHPRRIRNVPDLRTFGLVRRIQAENMVQRLLPI
jgi:hypothetical protein